MVKKYQSKSLRLQNADYRKFVQAYLNYDQNQLKIGYDKGYRVGKSVFLDRLVKEINTVLNWENFDKMITADAIEYLNPYYVNERMNGGYTLLDVVNRLFTDAIDLSDHEVMIRYFLASYHFYLLNLKKIGAELSQSPVYPKNTIIGDQNYINILILLEALDPNFYESSEEEMDED